MCMTFQEQSLTWDQVKTSAFKNAMCFITKFSIFRRQCHTLTMLKFSSTKVLFVSPSHLYQFASHHVYFAPGRWLLPHVEGSSQYLSCQFYLHFLSISKRRHNAQPRPFLKGVYILQMKEMILLLLKLIW